MVKVSPNSRGVTDARCRYRPYSRWFGKSASEFHPALFGSAKRGREPRCNRCRCGRHGGPDQSSFLRSSTDIAKHSPCLPATKKPAMPRSVIQWSMLARKPSSSTRPSAKNGVRQAAQIPVMFSKAWDFASFLLYAFRMPSVCHPSVQRAPNHLGGKGPRKVGDADAARIAHAFDNQRIGGAGGGCSALGPRSVPSRFRGPAFGQMSLWPRGGFHRVVWLWRRMFSGRGPFAALHGPSGAYLRVLAWVCLSSGVGVVSRHPPAWV